MAELENSSSTNSVPMMENNELIQRISSSMKRTRSSAGTGEKMQDEKRRKEEYAVENEEIELRDRLLDELSSSQSSQDSDSIHSNANQFQNGGCLNETYQQIRKIIKLEGPLPNLALPDGWIALNHRSGGIVYLHRATRVCTWARPYYIGKGSVRKHDVPVAAIPCLHQTKALLTKAVETHAPSATSSQKVDDQSGQGVSVLNFLNTAGTIDSQPEPDTAQDEADGSHQPSDTKEMDLKRADGSTTTCSNDISLDDDLQKENDDSINSKQDSNIYNTSLVQENQSNSTNQINIDEMHVDDENGKSGENQAQHTTGPFDLREKYHGKESEGINMVDKGDDDSGNIVETVDCQSDQRPQKANEIGVFNPKDGLEVVNNTLSVSFGVKQADEEQQKTTSNAPIPSSELELSPKCPQSMRFKSIVTDEVKNENSIDLENNDASTEASYSPNLQSLSLKGIMKEKERNAPSSEEANRSTTPNCNIQNTKSKNFKSPEAQTTSDNDFRKSQYLPKTTHQTSGIELIDSEELSSYLSKLFNFEELTLDQEQNAVKPSDPVVEEGDSILSTVLECLPYCVKGKYAKENKGWVLNPGGKTPVAILHEYSQAVLKEKPVYVSSECENASTPFMAEVQIDGITHGSGVASTKKQAKQIAAEVALEVFLPNVFHKIRDYVISREELECFDKLKIDNSNIYELSIKSGLPTPSQVLQECLKRNQGVCSTTIHFKMIPGPNQDHRFVISCGKHTAEGPCKNKKIGKQMAAQALLMKLHPHISTWGSLLRIYCDRPSSIVKKYKTQDKESLSSCTSTPDVPRGQLLLARLKEEMLKIADNGNQVSKYAGPSDVNSISTVDI